MEMILAFLSSLPETAGLLAVCFVLILSSVLLRRALGLFENGIPTASQNPEPREPALK